jgi:CubicO group peptidase (beta-lactamase class C family)
MSAAKLTLAEAEVRRWVETGEIVGAVMLVVRRGRVVLHEAVGWADREAGIPLRTDHIFRMRSMTKPFVGTSILMLMEEGRLALDDRVAQHLEFFDTPQLRDITIFHLLTHTSGINGTPEFYAARRSLSSTMELARHAARVGRTMPPEQEFSYSDAGSSVLAAIVGEVSGVPTEEFIRRRVLDPLGMSDSFATLTSEQPEERQARVLPLYEFQPDVFFATQWVKYWEPGEPPDLSYFRGSGGLFATAPDYARFLEMLLGGGTRGDSRFLSEETVRMATGPRAAYVYPSDALDGMDQLYGLHFYVWTPLYAPVSEGTFGHYGSDGTLGWVDPAEDLIGIYFTQSRRTQTGKRFMRLVQEAIVG